MKNSILIISSLVLLATTIMLGVHFDNMLQNSKLSKTQLHIYPLNKTFIQADDLQKFMNINDSLYRRVNMSKLEEKLEQNAYVSKAEVYKDLNGKLVAEVEQYHPIARVMGARSYYFDRNGEEKPLSNYYTENVVLVFGKITTQNKEKVLNLLQEIYRQNQLNDIISEVHIQGKLYLLRLKNLSSKIYLSGEKNTNQQLQKLATMYAYLTKNNKNRVYKQIDLQYANQVVCKK